MKFRVDEDVADDATVTITPDAKVFYRRFPEYDEQTEHGELANATEDAEREDMREDARADGGTSAEDARTQSLVGVYERVEPSLPTIELTGADLKEAAENGQPVTESLDDALANARSEFEDDPRAFCEPDPGASYREQSDVPPEAREDEDAFSQYLDRVFTGEPVPTPWQADVRIRCSRRPDEGTLSVSVQLVNTHGEDFANATECDAEWQTYLFDTQIGVGVDGVDFLPFESQEIRDEYQYDGEIYAVGENCAVDSPDGDDVDHVKTTTVPLHEQPKYRSRETVPAPFGELSGDGIDSVLGTIATEMERAAEQYDEVRDEVLEGKSEDAEEQFEEALEEFVAERKRFQRGRELIAEDDDVARAFRALNETFSRMGEEFTEWRLFQIIFIVMSVPDIVAQADPSRDVDDQLDIGDVIYFPTGGGKTEAYLGLVVFTAFYDRLRGKDFGTTAWTKFPLRLLSLQQLQRIANVLCQAETVRREEDHFGGEEFSVGYFVGKNNTPNKVIEDGGDVNNAAKARDDEEMQEDWLIVSECPYCGEDSVEVTGDERRLRIVHRCTNSECPEVRQQGGETAELPVYITDEEVYRYAPTFVVSTIDKIAIMGMQRRARTLFGRVKHRCPDHGYTGENRCLCDEFGYPDRVKCDSSSLEEVGPVDPPSLFIQDELHLLREEFGAFDSHYETFLQEWMSEVTDSQWNPKYVAATATIAGAEEQVRSLYWRDAKIFPSQGPRLKQSFYAYEDPHQLGRQMVGAVPRSVSRTFAINTVIKEYAQIIQEFKADLDDLYEALLEADATSGPLGIPDDPDKRDELLENLLTQYETQISYNISKSNSDMLQRSVKTMINWQLESHGDPYEALTPVSLTGETPMSVVRDALARLESDDPDRPIDIVIATSMISHGVDVDRFNFISFFGMPRNTAEYIQAYSRVGRKHTGSVFLLFDSMRARDRSHYTRFDHYHRYQDLLVEATPLERWAEFAVECTLPGIFAGLIIQYYDELLEDEYDDRVYLHEGLQEAARNGDIDREEMRDMVLRCYAVTEDYDREWADTTGMQLYREKVESYFDELWTRAMKKPLDPKKSWIGFLLDRKDDHRGPMRSLRDIDEQIPVYPTPNSAPLLNMLSDE
ncbi:helicase-related protein [Halarchaeum acidiphilum]|uniref:helicase-related protein n=1 Tax=Halarchaeum acidiphilum TaxID=489138 RepID=UPI001902B66D|nr:helicase-related protein [Halarchaeum acidiphilum]